MKLMIEWLDGEQKGEIQDVSDNLYFFEENFFRTMDENGVSVSYHGDKIRIFIQDEKKGA